MLFDQRGDLPLGEFQGLGVLFDVVDPTSSYGSFSRIGAQIGVCATQVLPTNFPRVASAAAKLPCRLTGEFAARYRQVMKYEPRLHIVLHQPEIPYNTGSVGRTCVAVGAKLWLVRPLGFRIDDYYLRRAGLDYWEHLEWEVVDDWPALQPGWPPTSPNTRRGFSPKRQASPTPTFEFKDGRCLRFRQRIARSAAIAFGTAYTIARCAFQSASKFAA